MVERAQVGSWRKPRIVAAVLGMVAAGVLMLGTHASSAQACGGGQFCAWVGASYSGGGNVFGCATLPEGFAIPESYSAKNHCGNQVEIGWNEGGGTNWKACMNPGGERPNPGRFNRYRMRYVAC